MKWLKKFKYRRRKHKHRRVFGKPVVKEYDEYVIDEKILPSGWKAEFLIRIPADWSEKKKLEHLKKWEKRLLELGYLTEDDISGSSSTQ